MTHAGNSSEPPATQCHRCVHCNREFSRAEHLARHERTHTKEKPYVCERCPEAYSRRDLLKRHEVKAHGYDKGRRQRRVSRVTSRSSQKARRETSEPSPNSATDVSPFDSSHGRSEMDLDSWSFTQWLESGPAWEWDHGAESSSWVMNLLQNQAASSVVPGSGSGFPEPSPLLDPALLGFPLDNPLNDQAALESSNHPIQAPTPATPSRAHPGPDGLTVPGDKLFITEDHQNLIGDRLLGSSLRDTWTLPPLVKLNQYVARFMACFHRHQPLFHEPTWVSGESPAAVVLAVCANGAQYCLETQAARRLFRAAVLLTTESPGEVTGVSALQADMLIVAFAAWSGATADLDVAMQFHGRLALDMRQAWAGVELTDGTATWEEWREQETLKRTTYCCFTVENLMSIAYDVASHLCLEDRHGLPAYEEQWRAADEASWNGAKSETGPQQWLTVQSVMQRLATDSLPPPTRIGAFGCHVVISSLCQSIVLFHKTSYGDAEAFAYGRQRLSRCLRRWQIMWESEPGSGAGASPDSPSGPMPFNSTAMLRIAHVRLAADHAPVRNMFALRGASEDAIAAAIASGLRPLPRDAYTSRAALQACLALRVPVQLGFAVIARTGFWAWSVQHALSYFECAVLLGRWLLAVQAVGVAELTPEENGILNLVEQIIEASPSRPEDAAVHLQAGESITGAILRLFVRLLDTGDVTVWGLSPRMSRVLEAWLRQIPM